MHPKLVSASLFAFLAAASIRGAENPEAILERREIAALPKVPSRATILKDAGTDSAKIGQWVHTVIEAKEKKANVELEDLKKKVRAEEDVRYAAERERRRRQEKYDQSFGGAVGGAAQKEKRAPIHMKLDFQVLEIDAYRAISETERQLQAVANEIAQNLSSLDHDGDGKLTENEYRDAAAIVVSTKRLFQSMDANGDGMISDDEIESARKLPQNMSAAIRAGREGASAPNFKIKPFDADSNGVLDVDERKALASAFVEISVKLGQEADFYKTVADNLAKAREIVAAKFADIEVAP